MIPSPRMTISAEELSQRLGKPVKTIRKWTREGKLPFVKFGREYLYRLASIDALLRDAEVPAVPDNQRRKGGGHARPPSTAATTPGRRTCGSHTSGAGEHPPTLGTPAPH